MLGLCVADAGAGCREVSKVDPQARLDLRGFCNDLNSDEGCRIGATPGTALEESYTLVADQLKE
jgi:hypothetical protein